MLFGQISFDPEVLKDKRKDAACEVLGSAELLLLCC